MLIAVVAAACGSKPDQREYPLQGQVIAVAGDRQQATINHEAITGLMSAMTMPYKVRDAKLLDGIAPGDLIHAKLAVLSNDAFLTEVKKVGHAPLPKPPADAVAMHARSCRHWLPYAPADRVARAAVLRGSRAQPPAARPSHGGDR